MDIRPLSDLKIRSDYESPIRMIYDNVVHDMNLNAENAVLNAVSRLGIDIDKDSLIQALEADRKRYTEAYERGYHDGYNKCYEDMSLTNDEWSGIR